MLSTSIIEEYITPVNTHNPLVRQLAKAEVFTDFPSSDLEDIAAHAGLRTMAAPGILFQQGHRVTAWHLVVTGGVKLVRQCPNKRMVTIDFAVDGAALGLEGLLVDGRYTTTAVVRQPSQVVSISASHFLDLLMRRSELNFRLLAYLSKQVLHYMVRSERLSAYSAEEKLAAYLLDHSDEHSPRRYLEHLPLKRKDLASLLSISPETLCRTIGKFRNAGWISTRDHSLTISRRRDLEQFLTKI